MNLVINTLDKMNITTLLDLINDRIGSLRMKDTPANLYDPIRYMLSMGGKRMRPLLTLMSYSLFKENVVSFIDPAIGLEVFHNFTLIHDDIMDNAPLRRGQSTVHKKWGDETAILSGDVMMIQAYQLVLTSKHNLELILRSFNTCALHVCEGQQMDIDFEKSNDVEIDDYLEMIRLKTAALLGFCMELGAQGAGASTKDISLAKSFGADLGIAFQLQDDMLDVFGESKKVGKQVGGDILSDKKTYLWIKAFELSDTEQRKKLNSLLNNPEINGPQKIDMVKSIYEDVGVLKYVQKEIELHFAKAADALDKINGSKDAKDMIRSFYLQLIKRDQ